jgi:trehalose-6-phosphate synthase
MRFALVPCSRYDARIFYIGSLHDGMNLVANEFIAARSDERDVPAAIGS